MIEITEQGLHYSVPNNLGSNPGSFPASLPLEEAGGCSVPLYQREGQKVLSAREGTLGHIVSPKCPINMIALPLETSDSGTKSHLVTKGPHVRAEL